MFGTGPAAVSRAEDLAAFGARVTRGAVPNAALVAGAFLVVIERDVADADARAIVDAARAAHALVYAVDRPLLSDLALPAVLRRGLLSVAVSTSGTSPILAQRLRDELARVLPDGLAGLAERLAALRERLRGEPPDERVQRQRDAVAKLRLEGELKLPDLDD